MLEILVIRYWLFVIRYSVFATDNGQQTTDHRHLVPAHSSQDMAFCSKTNMTVEE